MFLPPRGGGGGGHDSSKRPRLLEEDDRSRAAAAAAVPMAQWSDPLGPAVNSPIIVSAAAAIDVAEENDPQDDNDRQEQWRESSTIPAVPRAGATVAAEAVEDSLEDHFARLDRELAPMLQEMRSAVETVLKLNSIQEQAQPLIAWRREQMAELHALMERRGALLSGGSGQGFPSYVVARNGGGNVLAEVARLDETIAAKLAENRAVLDALELLLQENCGLVGSCRELRDRVARCAQTALRTVGRLGEISEATGRDDLLSRLQEVMDEVDKIVSSMPSDYAPE